MRRILAQTMKEWAEFKRDRLSLSLAFLLPLITLLLFGYGVRLQSHDIPVMVQDDSKSALSRAFIERLTGTNLLRPIPCPEGLTPDRALKTGTAKAVVIIPADFEKAQMSGKESKLQCFVDGTDIVNARLMDITVKGAAGFLVRSLELAQQLFQISPNLRIWFNPGLQESLFIVPSAIGVVCWMFPSLLSCVAVAREKEQGTTEQMFVSSLSPYEMISGKSLVYLAIGLCQALIVILVACLLFGLRFAGNPGVFWLTVPVFVFLQSFSDWQSAPAPIHKQPQSREYQAWDSSPACCFQALFIRLQISPTFSPGFLSWCRPVTSWKSAGTPSSGVWAGARSGLILLFFFCSAFSFF